MIISHSSTGRFIVPSTVKTSRSKTNDEDYMLSEW